MHIEPYEALPEAPPENPSCAHPGGGYRQLGVVPGKGSCMTHTCLGCGAKWRVWLSRAEPAE